MQTDDVTVIPLALMITRQTDERTEEDKAMRMTRGERVEVRNGKGRRERERAKRFSHSFG